jgi:glyoxylase-like metal-dependent hydrolase (beta-lactamase superfamily II)
MPALGGSPDVSGFNRLKREFGIDTIFLDIPSMGMRSNVYVMNTERATIMFDTGQKTPSNIEALSRYIERRKKPVYLLLTHEHTDHIGLAGILRRDFGATVFIHGKSKGWMTNFEAKWDRRCDHVLDLLASCGFPEKYVNYFDAFRNIKAYAESFESDHYVNDGDLLDVAGRTIRVIYTPGHSVGSACYYDEEHGLLFCGDHTVGGRNVPPVVDYIGNGEPGYSPLESCVESYSKLEKCGLLSFALPGHGDVITELRGYRSGYVEYMERYKASILGLMNQHGGLTPFELYMLLYDDSSERTLNHFFGRVQLLVCVLDSLERDTAIRRNKRNGKRCYSMTKGR